MNLTPEQIEEMRRIAFAQSNDMAKMQQDAMLAAPKRSGFADVVNVVPSAVAKGAIGAVTLPGQIANELSAGAQYLYRGAMDEVADRRGEPRKQWGEPQRPFMTPDEIFQKISGVSAPVPETGYGIAADIFGQALGGGMATGAVKSAGSTNTARRFGEMLKTQSGAPAAPEKIYTMKDAKALAAPMFEQARQQGAGMRPSDARQAVSEIRSLTTEGRVGNQLMGGDILTKAADEIETALTPISYRTPTGKVTVKPDYNKVFEADEMFSNLIEREYVVGKGYTPIGRRLIMMQEKLLDAATRSDPDTKNLRGAAKKIYSMSFGLNDLERIASRASMTDNPAQSIKSGIRTLVSNETKMRAFPQQIRVALRDVAEKDDSIQALRVLGSRLNSIIAFGAGNAPGAAIGTVGGAVARGGAEALATARLNRVVSDLGRYIDSIASGKPLPEALNQSANYRAAMTLIPAAQTVSKPTDEEKFRR